MVERGQWMDLGGKKIISLWKDPGRNVLKFFCPVCRAPRRLPYRPEPGGFLHWFQISLGALIFTLLFYPWLGWKGLVSIVPFWTIFEIVYRYRVRGVLTCEKCGFDPYLFLMDEEKAKREMELHWEKKFIEKGIPLPEKRP